MKKSIGLINVEPLKYKNGVLAVFKNYKAWCEKQTSCQLKVLDIDGEKKYMQEFDDYFKEYGIIYKVTTPTHLNRTDKSKELTA